MSSVVAVMECASALLVDEMLRYWKLARLSSASEDIGYPRINILVKALMGRGQPQSLPDDAITDAEIIQTIVEKMPDEMREAFEARHLALIRGRRHRGMRHKDRARILTIPLSTYWYRVSSGHRFIAIWLEEMLD